MKNWYHCILGQVKGPFSLLQMEKMVEQKKIDVDDLVYCSGEKKWTCVKDRWQFQKAILKRNRVQDMPKKDWVILKPENVDSIENKGLCNYQYICYSKEEVLKALHRGEISYSHWIWTHGMKSWKCIRNLPLFNKQVAVKNAEKTSNVNQFNLGAVSDIELSHSVVKAKPASALTPFLIDVKQKPIEAQGPDLTKQFGNLKLDHFFSKQNKTPNRKHLETLLHESAQKEKFSKHLVSSLTKEKNNRHSYLNKGICVAGIIITSLCMTIYFLLPSYVDKKIHRKSIPLQYEVLHNGLELHFWVKEYADSNINLRIRNDKEKTLTANDFEYNIKLVLNQSGHAVLRLDHLDLVEGYYTFLGQIDDDKEFHRKFFVGSSQQEFAYKLSEFHKTRQEERQKVEEIKRREIVNVISETTQPVSKGMKTLYGQVRQLEKGYDKYNKDIKGWKNFYSSWESSFHQLQSSALGSIKEELDLELTKELQTIEQELKVMSQQMDQSVKESHIEGFDLLSPQVAVFLEKMKSNTRF